MPDIFDRFINYAHSVNSYGLQLCSSGNISLRVGDGTALISGTGSWLERLNREEVAVCDIFTGNHLSGAKPSMESGFHLGILKNREDVNIVLHFQSMYATALCCMKQIPDNFNFTAEIPIYIGEVGIVPYFTPGSLELAEAVTKIMMDHNVAILRNHGQIVCGETFDEVVKRALFFEMACSIAVNAGNREVSVIDHI